MYLEISKMLKEATAPYDNPDIEYGLMTLDEFYKSRNPDGKWHPDSAYKSTIASLNKDYSRSIIFNDNTSRSYRSTSRLSFDTIVKNKKGYSFEREEDVIAVISGDTLYYTNKFNPKNIPFRFTNRDNEEFDIDPSRLQQVKYITDYVAMIDPAVEDNLDEFPKILQHIKIGGKDFTVRTTPKYGKNNGAAIAILNSNGLVVAMATNEWGTTLLQVAGEYSGLGLGKVIGKYWYDVNPEFGSGGFTQSGYNNAKHIWADRVRKLLENGWYTELVKAGKITREKIKEIIADLPAKKTPPKPEEQIKAEPLVYADGTSFIIYDRKFFTDQDEKYIYAYGFYRGTEDRLFLYRIDYDKGYKKIATLVALQMAYDEGDTVIDVSSEASDFVEYDGIDNIEVINGDIHINAPLMKLNDFSKLEKLLRKNADPYSEIYNQLVEMAESKWS